MDKLKVYHFHIVDCKSAVWLVTMATKVTVTTWTSQSKVIHKGKPVYLEKIVGGELVVLKIGVGNSLDMVDVGGLHGRACPLEFLKFLGANEAHRESPVPSEVGRGRI